MTYPLRRRTPAETRAYFQGFNSGIEAAAQVAESRAKVWEEATRADMHSPCAMSLWEECEDIAQRIRLHEQRMGWLAERKRLREALRPFANIPLTQDGDKRALDMIDGPDLAITPAHVRAAREALGEPQT